MKQLALKVNVWWWSLAAHKPFRAAALGGVLLAIAFPPVPLGLLAGGALVPLLMILEARLVAPEAPKRVGWRAFKYTYVYFIVWNLLTTYWLLLTGHGMPDLGTQISGAFSGIMANVLNPVVQFLPVLLYVFLRRRLPLGWALTGFALGWVSLEYLHFNWELTWSWITLGHALSMMPWYVQYIEWTGVLGASLFLVVLNVLLFRFSWQARNGVPIHRKPLAVFVGLLLLPLVLYPLLTHPARAIYDPAGHLRVRIIQPNIDPYGEKFDGLSPEGQVDRMLRQITRRPTGGIDLVVLPETALPRGIREDRVRRNPYVRQLMAPLAPDSISVLTGLVSYRVYPSGRRDLPASASCRNGRCYDNWNAATMLWAGRQRPRIYQKAKLVPFSERTPFLEHLEFLKSWNLDLGGAFGSYAMPDSTITLRTQAGHRVGPIICYESIFGGYVRRLVNKGAELLCIVTNDGWWGRTSGYLQHSAYARLRAIELRRSIARCANTGESSVINPRGFMRKETPWWEKAVIDAEVPLLRGKTLYAQWGDWLPALCLLGSAGLVGLALVRRR